MTSADNTAISLDRSGDLTFSISNTVLNSKRHKTDGIQLAPVLRPNALKMVRTPWVTLIFLTFLKANVGDSASLAALKTQCEYLDEARARALDAYNTAHDAMKEFKARALLWVEYSNKKMLTEEEQILVDKVWFISF